MDTLDAIYARRSIRRYEERPVEPEKLTELARLAMAAPSAMNRCPWEIVLVDDPGELAALRAILPFGKFAAPAAVIVCGNMKRGIPAAGREFWVQDCAAAMENLLLGATALGLGSVWLGVWPLRSVAEKLSAHFGIPPSVIPLGVAYIGYPAEEKEPRTQYRPEWVHVNRMGPARPARPVRPGPDARARRQATLETMRSRRSIREYTGEPITDDDLETLLRAGFCAPTARNLRPWHFIAVRDGNALGGIAEIHPYAKMLPRAGCGIVVCGDRAIQPEDGYLALDCAAAIQNILLAAHALGLGAVWLGVWPRAERVEKLRGVLSIPETILPVGIVAVGHPAEEKLPRDSYDAARVHRDRWS